MSTAAGRAASFKPSLCEKTVLSAPKLLICNAATAAEMAFSHRLNRS